MNNFQSNLMSILATRLLFMDRAVKYVDISCDVAKMAFADGTNITVDTNKHCPKIIYPVTNKESI